MVALPRPFVPFREPPHGTEWGGRDKATFSRENLEVAALHVAPLSWSSTWGKRPSGSTLILGVRAAYAEI